MINLKNGVNIKKKILITVSIICFYIFSQIKAKTFDEKIITCADETGPLFQFTVPSFEKLFTEKEILLKVFQKDNRTNYNNETALIEKKTSPIDTTYFFYHVKFNLKKANKSFFEFFPPSHLIMKNKTTLVCWESND